MENIFQKKNSTGVHKNYYAYCCIMSGRIVRPRLALDFSPSFELPGVSKIILSFEKVIQFDFVFYY
jgi:hypothetical protein